MDYRDLLASRALAELPTILTLQDRNPHSPTFGCFDRNFWHYRIIDFPTGMSQEFVWPLALAYSLDIPGNRFFGQKALVDWVIAGIRFAAKSSHADGSCDDYFPYERAGGAASFSLLGMLESYKLLGLNDSGIKDFFVKRARWLAGFHEAGQLTNHQGLIALVLDLMGRFCDTSEWEKARDQRVERILEWQNKEGWYQEYEGFDPGYQTITISLLSWMNQLEFRSDIRDSLRSAIWLVSEIQFPDGSYGGEIGSRNTYNFFPHGFEIAGRWMPEALSINDRFLAGMKQGLSSNYSDDHHIAHHVWNYLLAWRDFQTDRASNEPARREKLWLPDAGIFVERRGSAELYVSTSKGGVLRFYRDGELVVSDTQLSLQIREGKKNKNAVAHLVSENEVKFTEDAIRIKGDFGWAEHEQMTTMKLIFLRLIMVGMGRFFPNFIRSLLQRRLITGIQKAPFAYKRKIEWEGSTLVIKDSVNHLSREEVTRIGVGSAQASIYVTMSRTFQAAQLQPWIDLRLDLQKPVNAITRRY